MSQEVYTPGHTANATQFMANRTFASHGQFFAEHLIAGCEVLDLGCGPGTISLGIAEIVAPGQVVGVDFGESQIEKARLAEQEAGTANLEFVQGSAYELPLEDGRFDRVFSHALMEHLARPVDALREAFRVLKPGGVIGICSPDADGWLLAPPSAEVSAAIEAYVCQQDSNGGDLRVGKRFGVLLAEAGFKDIELSARYECYPDRERIAAYLALQLDAAGRSAQAVALREWCQQPASLFAQAWVSAIARKP